MKTEEKKYKCFECEEEFDNFSNNKCPKCGVEFSMFYIETTK